MRETSAEKIVALNGWINIGFSHTISVLIDKDALLTKTSLLTNMKQT